MQVKCDHYWPFTDEPVAYGEIAVEMLTESESADWTVRNFRLNYVSISLQPDNPKIVIGQIRGTRQNPCRSVWMKPHTRRVLDQELEYQSSPTPK